MDATFLPHHRLADVTAAAQGAHLAFDAAEGAALSGNAFSLAANLDEGEAELRRAAAHLGFGLVPLEDCPPQARVEAARLIAGEA